MQQHHFQFGPTFTPPFIKIFIGTIFIINLVLSIFDYLFPDLYLPLYLGLSWFCFEYGFIWQFITAPLLINPTHFSTNFFVHLIINCYLIWTLSVSIYTRLSKKNFYGFIIGAWIVIDLAASFSILGSTAFSYFNGNTALLCGLAIAFMMLNPHSNIFLLHTLKLQARWIILFFLGLSFVLNIINHHWPLFFAYLFAAIYAYFYSLLIWHARSEIAVLTPIEIRLVKFSWAMKNFFTIRPKQNDAEFMDAMLKKIAEDGRQSLSKKEKRRLDKISKKKKH